MLQLKVNSEFVDLGSNPQITIDEESPVFEKDTIPGGFGYPFSLPVTDLNRRIFGFPERIEKRDPMTIDQDFELYHSGLLRSSGTITITEADESYRAYLAVGSGNFSSKIQGKKLKDVDFGGSRAWVNKAEFTQADNFTLFPIFNPDYLSSLSGYNWAVNKYKLNHFDPSTSLFITAGTFAISPFPFLSYMVEQIFNQYGFAVKENILKTDPELKKIVMYTSHDAAEIVKTTTLKEVTVEADPYEQYEITEWIEVTTTSRSMSSFDLVNCMPDVSISDFVKWLRNRLNIAIEYDRYNNVKIIRRDHLVKSTDVIDITSQAVGDPTVIGIEAPDGFKLSWQHDSNDVLFDSPDFQKIDDNLELFKGSVATYTILAALTPNLNDIYYVESLDRYFQYSYLEDIGDGTGGYIWQNWSMGFQNYWADNAEEEFSSEISTLRMINFQREVAGPSIRCPFTKQLSNGEERPAAIPFSVRLLLYQGLQKDTSDNDIPTGSSDNLDKDENQITGANLTMKWDGTYGIYNQLWKDYLTWWLKRKQVNWTMQDPSTLQFIQKYIIDRNHYLLKKRSIIFTQHKILPGSCEWYLV